MKTMDVVNQSGEVVGTVPVPELLSDGEVHQAVLHQVIVAYLANRRQGTASTKTRAEVKGSGRKLFRQKGLGRARMGDIRSPIRVHGGIVFGPKPRSYRQQTPRKMRRLALLSALRDKFQNDAVRFLQELPDPNGRPRTKEVVALLERLGLAGQKVLFVVPEHHPWLYLSARNLPRVNVTTGALLNAYEVLTHQTLVLLPGTVEVLMQRLDETGAGQQPEAEVS
ncbi:MAG: 50S ribosomal protein L4 [Candidatus Poribacteria bacterium]|nr:MAG: 50S ribosomal protein L4 [Candidatus Poribacteria bacterium]